MKLDVTYRLGHPTLDKPMGGYEVKIDDQVVDTIRHIDLDLDADALPEATITYACYEGVTWIGEVNAHHVCPLPARLPPGAPTLDEIRKALAHTQLAQTDAIRVLRCLARAFLPTDEETE